MSRASQRIQMAAVLLAVCWPWLHPFARGPTGTIEPLVVALLSVALLMGVAAWNGPLRVPRAIAYACFAAAFVLFAGDSMAHDQLGVTPAVAGTWLVFAGIAACAIATASLVQEDSFVETFAWAWVAAGVISTLFAFAQVAGWTDYLGGWVAHSPQREAIANLRQRNHFATLACIALLSLVWLLLHARSKPSRAIAGSLAVLLCGGVAASASRTGALELVIVLAITIWWHRKLGHSTRWPVLLLASYGAAALALLWFFRGSGIYLGIVRRMVEGVPDCPSRTVLWQNMASLVADKPWTGWGWRELSFAAYQGTFEPRFCALVENAHNLPLHLAVELGIPTAVAFIAACVFALWRARPWRESDASRLLAWGVLALIAVHSLTEYPLWYGPFQMAFGISLGVLARDSSSWSMPRMAAAPAAIAIAIVAGYVAWDFHRVGQLYVPPVQRSPTYREDTLAKARASWLFQDYVAYAELRGTPLVQENSRRMFDLAGRVMHFSPESPVIQKRIQAARLSGQLEEAEKEIARYRAAYPADYAAWAAR